MMDGPLPLWVAIAALVVLCRLLGSKTGAAVASVLLGNWCVNTALAYVMQHMTGDSSPPSAIYFTIDWVSAAVVLMLGERIKIGQIAIGVTFALMIGCHAVYALQPPSVLSNWQYWWRLHDLAWAQFWIVLGWGAIDGISARRSGRDILNSLADRLALDHEP